VRFQCWRESDARYRKRSAKRSDSRLKVTDVVTFYPPIDLSINPQAKKVASPSKAHAPFLLRLFNDCYVPDKAIRDNALVSPSQADAASSLSTVVIVTCEGDNLAPEGDALDEKLKDGRRTVVYRVLKGMLDAPVTAPQWQH
jgi:acetyl esterase/lipase